MDARLRQAPSRNPTKKKIPKTRYPRNIENWYARELQSYVRSWQTIALKCVDSEIKPYIKGGANMLNDADNSGDPTWLDRIKSSVDLMAYTIARTQPDTLLTRLATRFVKAISNFSYRNVKAQAGIVGLNPIQSDKNLDDFAKAKIQENVSLIKTMRSNYYNRVQDDIYRNITTGKGITSVTADITKHSHMSNDHAKLVANDQTGSIVSNVDAYRAKSAGAEKYVWRSMEDGRVRPLHRKLDGKTFSYDDPNGGDHGQLPGEPIACRCYADPVF